MNSRAAVPEVHMGAMMSESQSGLSWSAVEARAVQLSIAAMPRNFDTGPNSAIGQLIRAIASGVVQAVREAMESGQP